MHPTGVHVYILRIAVEKRARAYVADTLWSVHILYETPVC